MTTRTTAPAPSSALALLRDPLVLCYTAFLALLPLARPALVSVGGIPVQLNDLAAAAGAAVWLGRLLRGKAQFPVNRLMLALAAFAATLVLSLVATGHLPARSLLKVVAYGVFLLFPLIAPQVFPDEAHLRLAVGAWLVGLVLAVVVGLVGIGAFYLHRPTGLAMMCGYGGVPAGNYPRLCAPFRGSSMFTNYLIASVGLLLAASNRLLGPVWRWTLAVASGIVALFTLSAGVGGFALAGAVALIGPRLLRGEGWRWRDRGLATAAVALAAFFTISMVATLQPAGSGNIHLGSRDLLFPDGMRPSIWKGIVPNIRAHPFTGLGYGSLVSLTDDPRAFTSPDLIPSLPRPIKAQRLEAHNIWLSVLGQAGLVGLLAFGWVVYEMLRTLRQVARNRGAGGAGLSAGLIGAFVGALLFHGMFSAVEEARHMWALFGLITAAAYFRKQSAPTD